MDFSLQEKIEKMRREPEHVRRRYVIVFVSLSMVLIFGIWLLSVQDNVTTVARDVPAALEQGKNLGGTPSLKDLFQQSAPLRVDDKNTKDGTFFEQQRAEAAPTPTQ